LRGICCSSERGHTHTNAHTHMQTLIFASYTCTCSAYMITADHFGAAIQPSPPNSRIDKPWACEWGVMGYGGKWARVRVFFTEGGWVEKWQVLEYYVHWRNCLHMTSVLPPLPFETLMNGMTSSVPFMTMLRCMYSSKDWFNFMATRMQVYCLQIYSIKLTKLIIKHDRRQNRMCVRYLVLWLASAAVEHTM